MNDMNKIIENVILKGGGCSALGRAIGITHAGIHRWRIMGRIPAARVLSVERLTGISRHDLRPDVFGPPPTPSNVNQEHTA